MGSNLSIWVTRKLTLQSMITSLFCEFWALYSPQQHDDNLLLQISCASMSLLSMYCSNMFDKARVKVFSHSRTPKVQNSMLKHEREKKEQKNMRESARNRNASTSSTIKGMIEGESCMQVSLRSKPSAQGPCHLI